MVNHMPFAIARMFLDEAHWGCTEIATEDGPGFINGERSRHPPCGDFGHNFSIDDVRMQVSRQEITREKSIQ